MKGVLEDHETLLADAIRPKPVVNTHGEVVDQSSSPPQGREGEREIGKSLSSLLSRCRTLRPLSVTVSLRWPRASGWRHSAAPSIHQSLPVSSYTHTHTSMFFSVSFAVSHFICLRQWGLLHHVLFTTALCHQHSCQSTHTGSGPEALGCPLFQF